ncbi:MAG TPA: nucleoside deaminase [Candidatus Krumholzibacteria bacterium]|nr:nucleoside deaminase [Candidatus Krumholzibacteria bacterium]
MTHDAKWMAEALVEAQVAFAGGEVPVGAVVVLENRVIGRGHNRTVRSGQPFEHAEIVALWDAVATAGAQALEESVLYSTVEPCVMCIGAVLLARIPRVVFGAREPRTGACESIFAIQNEPRLLHRPVVIGGIEEASCRGLMQRFFSERRGP